MNAVPKYGRIQTQQGEAATLRTLNVFAVDVIAIPSVEDLFWYVAQNVVGRLNFIDCVIYQADPSKNELTQVAALGEKNPFGRNIINPLKIQFGDGITGQVAENRKAVIVDDLLKDQNYIADTQLARSEICVPLVIGDRVVGVIDSEHPEPNAFGKAELDVLTTVAAMTSAKLELLAEADRSKRRYHEIVQSHAQLAEKVTNRKALEAKLFKAQKLEAIGHLSGRFAHEFNNLLTVVSVNLEFLESDLQNPEMLECLSDAQTATARGVQLVRDLLAYSQRTRLNPVNIDVNNLAAKVCENCLPMLKKGVHLETDLQDDLWQINADQKSTSNALLNLILNAHDAMPEGGNLCVSTKNVLHNLNEHRVFITDLAPGSYVRLSVKDQGVGIPNDRVPQIFDPFFTTKIIGAGPGLGLSTILGFLQQSGGTVAVETKPNYGSTFHLYFPAIEP